MYRRHNMLCPNPACAALEPRPVLVITERQGIEIDYCPHCRGVWLDRGELDKLIVAAASVAAPVPPPSPAPARPDSHRRHDDTHYGYGHGKRKKSLLAELFDFD